MWTSARAVQRGFCKTIMINDCIEHVNLKFIRQKMIKSEYEYDNYHRNKANLIIDFFNKNNKVCSYGRAAKIIAIYLKTFIVISENGNSLLASIIHPPIDRTLLKAMDKKTELTFNNISWTKFDESEYFEIINSLRRLDYSSFWEVEKYWYPYL